MCRTVIVLVTELWVLLKQSEGVFLYTDKIPEWTSSYINYWTKLKREIQVESVWARFDIYVIMLDKWNMVEFYLFQA